MKVPRAASHLQNEGKRFWRKVLNEFQLEDSHHLKILQVACECLDRITEARAEVEKEGAYIKDRFNQTKEHPGQKTERDNKILFARLIRELQLDIPPEDPRPPRQY
ncbi:MAG: hypothetical protein KQH63_18485 [Desulfobulbaceae bacterium]|nr:hypothetical protein [Desulfobulbaceae bacterium]